jgi:hypothetical protein
MWATAQNRGDLAEATGLMLNPPKAATDTSLKAWALEASRQLANTPLVTELTRARGICRRGAGLGDLG